MEAVVIRTGFLTERGILISSALYPKEAEQYHVRDVDKLIAILLPIALIAFLYLMTYKVRPCSLFPLLIPPKQIYPKVIIVELLTI